MLSDLYPGISNINTIRNTWNRLVLMWFCLSPSRSCRRGLRCQIPVLDMWKDTTILQPPYRRLLTDFIQFLNLFTNIMEPCLKPLLILCITMWFKMHSLQGCTMKPKIQLQEPGKFTCKHQTLGDILLYHWMYLF